MKVKLVSYTTVDIGYTEQLVASLPEDLKNEFKSSISTPEGLMVYCARVSSKDQLNPNYARLMKYCLDHGHVSIFEMADATFEIETSRAIAAQILRHKSFSFQEFSQRYQEVSSDGVEFYEARRQDSKNRQNSIDDLSTDIKTQWLQRQQATWKLSMQHYKWAVENGVAKECARMVLPLETKTKLFMKGSLRSWIHYLQIRADEATQLEHREIALAIQQELTKRFPVIGEAAGWTSTKT